MISSRVLLAPGIALLLSAGCAGSPPSGDSTAATSQASTGTSCQEVCSSCAPNCSGGQVCHQVCSSAGGAVTLYVATDGNDAWSGELSAPNHRSNDGPLATFDHARQVVQQLDKTGLTAITVQFRGGTYWLREDPSLGGKAEMFGPADSGTATMPITYEAYPGETPVFSGGMLVTGWTKAGKNRWTAPIAPGLNPFENLYYAVNQAGSTLPNPFGQRRLRPRAGSSATGNVVGSYLRIVSAGGAHEQSRIYAHECKGQGPELSAGSPLYECRDRFYYDPAEIDPTTWTNLGPPPTTVPPPPGATCDPPTNPEAPGGAIQLVDFERWTAARQRIYCVDTTQHIIYLTGETGGSDLWRPYGYIPANRYVIENLQNELSVKGQWFFDGTAESGGTLTYLSQAGEDPTSDTVIIPQLPQLLVAANLSYVQFSGLSFAHDDTVVPDGGFGAGMETPAAVSFQNSSSVLFDSGSVSQTSGTGLEFISCVGSDSPWWCVSSTVSATATTRNDTIQNSGFWDLGSHGIRIGGDGSGADTKQNVPKGNLVTNNVVRGYGRVYPDSQGILQGQGDDNTYQLNEIEDGYKAAIRVRYVGSQAADATGVYPSGNTIQYNLVHDLFQGVLNDGGALYFGVGNKYGSGTGNTFLNNVVHDVTDASVFDENGYGGDAFYADEWTSGVTVTQNLAYRVSGSGVTFSGPRLAGSTPGLVTDNIFAYARTAMIRVPNPYQQGQAPPAPLYFRARENVFYFDRDKSSTNASASNPLPYSPLSPPPGPAPAAFFTASGEDYSGTSSYETFQVWNDNVYWRVPNSFFQVDGDFADDAHAFHVSADRKGPPQPYYFAADPPAYRPSWQVDVGEDTGSFIGDPGFVDPGAPGDVYTFPDGKLPIAGFEPMEPVSPTVVPIMPPAVPPGFLTATFDRTYDF